LHEGERVLPPGPQTGEPSPEESVHRLEVRPWDRSLPADRRGGWDDAQRAAPVELAGEPDQDETAGIRCPPQWDIAFLVQRQWLAQTDVFRGERKPWAQTQEQEAPRSTEEHQPRACERHEVTE
jgi:hypothetical protein